MCEAKDIQAVISKDIIMRMLKSVCAKPHDSLTLTLHPDNTDPCFPYILRLQTEGGRWCQRGVPTPTMHQFMIDVLTYSGEEIYEGD